MKYIILIILLIPTIQAFDCSYFDDPTNCENLKPIDESLIPNLIYTPSLIPNHNLVQEYNNKITEPIIEKHSQTIIKDAWFKILTVEPSIIYKNKTYVPNNVNINSNYDYKIQLPKNYNNNNKQDNKICKLTYQEENTQEILKFNNQIKPKSFTTNINKDTNLKAELTIKTRIKEKEYRWDKYCSKKRDSKCKEYSYDCKFEKTNYMEDILILKDEIKLTKYQDTTNTNLTFINNYLDTNKIELTTNTNTVLNFNNSQLTQSHYKYSAVFTTKPYITIKAEDYNQTKYNNMIKNNNTLYIKDISNCSLTTSNFFKTNTTKCDYNFLGENIEPIEKQPFNKSINLILILSVFAFINILIYKILKKSLGKVIFLSLLILLIIPYATAVKEDDCSITNLGSCMTESIHNYTLDLFNAPLQPLLTLAKNLLEEPVQIDLFLSIWKIIVYAISMFYGLLFIYSGFQFIVSGHDVIKREMAKEWLKNTLIMIVLVQAFFYFYELALEVGAVMTSSILSLVDPHFFLITADNLSNVNLEFFFLGSYVLVLFLTILLLAIRYLIIVFGVLFVPIAIFCYFIPPLRSYGKLIINLLGMFIFISFLSAIIILACSMLITIPIFENFKILVMICCFLIIDLLFMILIWHSIVKSVIPETGRKVSMAIKYIGDRV